MRKRIIWMGVAFISFAAIFILSYWQTRRGSDFFLPMAIIPAAILLVSWIVLFSLLVVALFSRRLIGISALTFGSSLLLMIPFFFVKPADAYQRGFNERMRKVLTPEEWRSIARWAQTNLPAESRLPGPEKKSLWEEARDRPLWNALCRDTPIQKLDPALMIFVRSNETEIVWGGALAGHRGVIIYSSSKNRKPSEDAIAEDIETYMSSD